MSLIPAFEIGVWNVWIFMLYHFLPMPILMLIHRGVTGKERLTPHSETEKKLYPVMWIVWLLAVIYSVFLPLRLGAIWFYIGLPISMVGLITYTIVIVTFATTPDTYSHVAPGLQQAAAVRFEEGLRQTAERSAEGMLANG